VIVLCGLAGAAAVGQPPLASSAGAAISLPQPVPSASAKPGVPPPAPSQPPTVDQLIDRLAELQTQKAELGRQEQAAVKALRELLARQTARLRQLGVIDEPPAKAEAGVGARSDNVTIEPAAPVVGPPK
jgi:hypothetical protein